MQQPPSLDPAHREAEPRAEASLELRALAVGASPHRELVLAALQEELKRKDAQLHAARVGLGVPPPAEPPPAPADADERMTLIVIIGVASGVVVFGLVLMGAACLRSGSESRHACAS